MKLFRSSLFAATMCMLTLLSTSETMSVTSPRPVVAHSGTHERWVPPLGKPFVVHKAFQQPPHPYAAGHRGLDLLATAGASIRSPTNATVFFAGRVVDRELVTLRTSDGLLITLEPVKTTLSAGSTVVAAENLGVVGSGGHCHETCVHIGVRHDGEYVNPLPYFLEKPRLLPWINR